MKKGMLMLMMVLALIGIGVPAYADNIKFDVTVGGKGKQDPLSKRKEILKDGDNNAYYRATKVSRKDSYIFVTSHNLSNSKIYTYEMVELCDSNLNQTRSRSYNKKAPGGQYYYMKAETEGPRINVKGYYCP